MWWIIGIGAAFFLYQLSARRPVPAVLAPAAQRALELSRAQGACSPCAVQRSGAMPEPWRSQIAQCGQGPVRTSCRQRIVMDYLRAFPDDPYCAYMATCLSALHPGDTRGDDRCLGEAMARYCSED
jgi:hypothetical protein